MGVAVTAAGTLLAVAVYDAIKSRRVWTTLFRGASWVVQAPSRIVGKRSASVVQRLRHTVLERAKELGICLPIKRRGGPNPVSVTDTCGNVNHYFTDHVTYVVQLGVTRILPPTRTFEGKGPPLLSEWSAKELQTWLQEHSR